MNHIKKTVGMKEYLIYALFLLGAFVFVLFFSVSTSPLYASYGSDSAIFQVIGKYWELGKIPYRDLFDHKGPFIFLVDAIGYFITGTREGIAVVQVISLFVSLIGIYKICSIYFEKRSSVCWTFVTLGFLSLSYEGGNLTEEYVFPFLVFSAYAQLKYMSSYGRQGKDHDYKWGVWYGVTFSLCVLTRMTNAVGLCSGILVILCLLIREKRWRNVGKNTLAVLAGSFLTALPFVIYFHMQDALYEMYYGTIAQNIMAAESVSNFWWSTSRSLVGWSHVMIAHLCSYGLMIAGIMAIIKKKKELAFYFLTVGILMTAYLFTRYAFYHYMMIATPFLPAVAAVCTDLKKYREKARALLAAVLFLVIAYQAFTVYRDSWAVAGSEPEYAQLLSEIPETDRDAFVAYNVKADIYLRYDIVPYYAYFHHQDAQASVNKDLRRLIIEEFGSAKAKWILVMSTEEDNCVEGILETYYHIVAQEGNYSLYCRL